MIHCYQPQDLAVKSEPVHAASPVRADQSYFLAGGQQYLQQQQQQQQRQQCHICLDRLPCTCNTAANYQPSSDEFYSEQRRQSNSRASSADGSANPSSTSSQGQHQYQQQNQQQQLDPSRTSNSMSLISSSAQISALPSCAGEQISDCDLDTKSQIDEQTSELYGRIYSDIESSRQQNLLWSHNLNGFDLPPSSSSSSASVCRQSKDGTNDFLRASNELDDLTTTAATTSPPTSGNSQEIPQAYRQQQENDKRLSFFSSDFNNNTNKDQQRVRNRADDPQCQQPERLFAPLVPTIGSSSSTIQQQQQQQHMSTYQRNASRNNSNYPYQNQYHPDEEYLSCFESGLNNDFRDKLSETKQRQYELIPNGGQSHHRNNGGDHQQQQALEEPEHSAGSNSPSEAKQPNERQQPNTDFYHHQHHHNQQQYDQSNSAGNHSQYTDSQAARVQQEQSYSGIGEIMTSATTNQHQHQLHHHHQQSPIFQDYYNYTNCDVSSNQQQYHGQNLYQSSYQTTNAIHDSQAAHNAIGQQDYSSLTYEIPKASTNLYHQLEDVNTTAAAMAPGSNPNQLHLMSSSLTLDEHADQGHSETSCRPASATEPEAPDQRHANHKQPAEEEASSKQTPPSNGKSRRGRPRKRSGHSRGKVSGKLWEFIRDLLLSERTNPSFIRWERREDGVFKFVQSDKVAKMWGERKQNPKMTYEKLSRAMRYYYKSKVLLPVFGRRLVYKFGPNATGWMCSMSASASSSPSLSHHSGRSTGRNVGPTLYHHNQPYQNQIENDPHIDHIQHPLDGAVHHHYSHPSFVLIQDPTDLQQQQQQQALEQQQHHQQQQQQQLQLQSEQDMDLLVQRTATRTMHFEQEIEAQTIY